MDGDLPLRLQDTKDGDIGHVPLARGSERAIERDLESRGFRVALKILDGSGLRAHRMAAGRAEAYAEKFSQ